jgi:hypothetical protein
LGICADALDAAHAAHAADSIAVLLFIIVSPSAHPVPTPVQRARSGGGAD